MCPYYLMQVIPIPTPHSYPHAPATSCRSFLLLWSPPPHGVAAAAAMRCCAALPLPHGAAHVPSVYRTVPQDAKVQQEADIIFMPYNYLIDPGVRGSLQVVPTRPIPDPTRLLPHRPRPCAPGCRSELALPGPTAACRVAARPNLRLRARLTTLSRSTSRTC